MSQYLPSILPIYAKHMLDLQDFCATRPYPTKSAQKPLKRVILRASAEEHVIGS